MSTALRKSTMIKKIKVEKSLPLSFQNELMESDLSKDKERKLLFFFFLMGTGGGFF